MPMATLREVLEFICQPAVKDIWLLLDIKVDNDAGNVVKLMGGRYGLWEEVWSFGGGEWCWGVGRWSL